MEGLFDAGVNGKAMVTVKRLVWWGNQCGEE